MARGGWRGGGRPRAWRLRSGEPAKLTRMEVIKEALISSKLIAHAIDDGIVTEAQVIEWVESQKKINIMNKCSFQLFSDLVMSMMDRYGQEITGETPESLKDAPTPFANQVFTKYVFRLDGHVFAYQSALNEYMIDETWLEVLRDRNSLALNAVIPEWLKHQSDYLKAEAQLVEGVETQRKQTKTVGLYD